MAVHGTSSLGTGVDSLRSRPTASRRLPLPFGSIPARGQRYETLVQPRRGTCRGIRDRAREASLVSTVLASLRKLTSPKLMGYKQRPWAKPFGSIGFTNSIDDMTVYSLFKPGRRHDGDVGFHRFAEEWEPVSLDGNIR